MDLELSSRRVGLRVHLVSTHLQSGRTLQLSCREGIVPPADLVLLGGFSTRARHAELLTASARIATALPSLRASTHMHKECVCSTVCLSKLVSVCCGPQFPREVGFNGPYFYHLPSIPGSPVQPFPQFKVSQRSVKSGSLGI